MPSQDAYIAAVLKHAAAPSEETIREVQDAHIKVALQKLRIAEREARWMAAEAVKVELMSAPAPEAEAEALALWSKAHKTLPAPDVVEGAIEHMFELLKDTFSLPEAGINKLLQTTAAVIGGSIPLQGLLKESWAHSDLDIYIPCVSTALIDYWHGFLLGAGYYLCEVRVDGCDYMREANPRLGDGIMEVKTYYKSPGAMVQLVVCRNLPRVLTAVDLTCTTVFYDGRALRSFEDMALIRKKVAAIRFPVDKLVSNEVMYRIKKYRKRGFLILDHERLHQLPPTEELMEVRQAAAAADAALANEAFDAIMAAASSAAAAEAAAEAAPTIHAHVHHHNVHECIVPMPSRESAIEAERLIAEWRLNNPASSEDNDIADEEELWAAYTSEDIAEAEEASRRAAQSVLAAVAAASATGEPDFAPPTVRAALAALNATY